MVRSSRAFLRRLHLARPRASFARLSTAIIYSTLSLVATALNAQVDLVRGLHEHLSGQGVTNCLLIVHSDNDVADLEFGPLREAHLSDGHYHRRLVSVAAQRDT